MKKIILDTNFLIDLGRFGIGIDEIDRIMTENYEMQIVSSSVFELKKIASTAAEESKFAKYALMIMDLRKIEILETNESADAAILSFADKDTIVATNDIELRKKLKEKGVRSIYVRARKKLEIG
jgi:rRNA-processing protein FCF1